MSTTALEVSTVQTSPFEDQKPGTSGLRKPVDTFRTPKYTENFVQSILNAIPETELNGSILIVGGDGRYFMSEAIRIIIQIAAANKVCSRFTLVTYFVTIIGLDFPDQLEVFNRPSTHYDTLTATYSLSCTFFRTSPLVKLTVFIISQHYSCSYNSHTPPLTRLTVTRSTVTGPTFTCQTVINLLSHSLHNPLLDAPLSHTLRLHTPLLHTQYQHKPYFHTPLCHIAHCFAAQCHIFQSPTLHPPLNFEDNV